MAVDPVSLVKIVSFTVSNRRLIGKFIVLVALGFLFLLLLLIAPFALLVSAPLAPPSITDIYIRGTDNSELATVEGYYGKLEINPLDVLAISAVIRKQDFSSASLQRVQILASSFVEKTGYRDKKVGYDPVFDTEGNIIGQTPRYETFPVYRLRSVEEVATGLGFTDDQKMWAIGITGESRQFTTLVGVGSGATLNWWTEVDHIFTRGMEVDVIDITSGKSFRMRRTGGRSHADSEPVTAIDSMIIHEIWGGWSWNRRPVIVIIDGQHIAASMNGMPHGFDTIPGNGMFGHLCIHFRHSWTHIGRRECVEHQAMVLRASGFIHDRVSRTDDAYDFAPEDFTPEPEIFQ